MLFPLSILSLFITSYCFAEPALFTQIACDSSKECIERAMPYLKSNVGQENNAKFLVFALKACDMNSYEGCSLAALIVAESGHLLASRSLLDKGLVLAEEACKKKVSAACDQVEGIKEAIDETKAPSKKKKKKLRETLVSKR